MLKKQKSQYYRQQKSERGFSIIEIIISLFLIGISLILFQVVAQTTVLNKSNNHREVALRAAETKIQEFKTTSYESLPTSSTFSNSQITSLPGGAGEFTITETEDGLSTVVVTVKWNNPTNSGQQKVTLNTFIARRGLGK